MASNQIRFDVKMNVDKASLNSLEKSLSDIMKMTKTEYGDLSKSMGLKRTDADLLEIKRTVNEVQLALKNSFNADLGSTNLAKFNAQLKSMDVNKLRTAFTETGTAGRIAFRNLASEVSRTKFQLKESHSLLNSMGDTLGRTLKWSISSSLINSFTGAIQKSFSYAKQLDASLTNIRIVSGESSENMEKFAKQANAAAQALGTTTTAYTDAALIYYQQGLKGTDVTERTDATIKMANVLGASAEEVSSYMTAIWNNFDDGSQSLEHYADVITALGASTASSSEEIATGLEKFAAVAETAGLSYDYATSALATVVATTRQSADTVGTAFKTIFARIQGLNLGETLDDGTTLNKYSSALQKVGISIKDQKGEVKDMDDILEEMGEKWQTLAKDQQLALAQTVAGTRQYSQLVALMDNWDFMKENLETAADATGTLNEQQETYMDSLEAHMKSFQSAKQNLYSSFIDTDSFKDLIDIFADLTNGVANFTKGIGGGGNALLALGSIAMTVFQDNITRSLLSTINNFKAAKYNVQQVKSEIMFLNDIKLIDPKSEWANGLADLKIKALQLKNVLSETQQQEIDNAIKRSAELNNEKDAWEEKIKQAQKYVDTITGNKHEASLFRTEVGEDGKEQLVNNFENLLDMEDVSERFYELTNKSNGASQAIDNLNRAQKDFSQNQALATTMKDVGVSTDSFKEKIGRAIYALGGMEDGVVITGDVIKDLRDDLKNAGKSGNKLDALADKVRNIKNSADETRGKWQEFIRLLGGDGPEGEAAKKRIEELRQELGLTKEQVDRLKQGLNDVDKVQVFTQTLRGVGQLVSGVRSLINVVNVLSDDSVSAGEKALQIISAISMGLPMVISGFTQMKTGFLSLTAGLLKVATAEEIVAADAVKMWVSVLGPIAAVVATIGIAYVVIKKFLEAYNEEADAAKKAAETATETRKALDDATAASEALKNSISGYDEAIETMNGLTKGTIEYEQALLKANEAALELIENSKGDLKYGVDYEYNDDGLIEFNKGAIQKANEGAVQREKAAFNANLQAQANAKTAQVEADKMKIAQQDDWSLKSLDAGGGVVGGAGRLGLGAIGGAVGWKVGSAVGGLAAGGLAAAGVGASLGSVVPVIGTAIGALAGFSIGVIAATDVINEVQKEGLNPIIEAYDVYGDAIFDNEEIRKKAGIEFADNSKEYIDSLRDMCQANKEAVDAQKQAAKQAAQTAFESDEAYQNLKALSESKEAPDEVRQAASQKKDGMDAIGAALYQSEYDKQYKDIFAKVTDSWLKDETAESQKLFNEYAQLKGLDVTDFDIKDDKVLYHTSDSDQELEVSREQIATLLASSKANKKLENSAEEVADAYDSLATAFKDKENASSIQKILSDNAGNLTKDEATKLRDTVENEYNGDLESYIEEKFTDEQKELFGGVDKIKDSLQDTVTKVNDKTFGNLPEDISSTVEKLWNGTNFSEKLTSDGIQTISTSLEKAFSIGGKEGAAKLTNIYKNMGSDAVQKFADKVKDIDFSSTSLKEFEEEVRKIPEAAKLTTEELKLLYQTTSNVDTFTSAVNSFGDALSKAKELKVGDIIDKDTWDNNFAYYEDAIGKYFTTMSDGTHKLTGDAIQFYSALENAVFDNLNTEFQDNVNSLNSLSIEKENLQEELKDAFGEANLVKPEGYDEIMDMLESREITKKDDIEAALKNPQQSIDTWIEGFQNQTIGSKDSIVDFNNKYSFTKSQNIEALSPKDTSSYNAEVSKVLAKVTARRNIVKDLKTFFTEKSWYLGDNDSDAGGYNNQYEQYYNYENNDSKKDLDKIQTDIEEKEKEIKTNLEAVLNSITSTDQLDKLDKDTLKSIQYEYLPDEYKTNPGMDEASWKQVQEAHTAIISGEDLADAKRLELHNAERVEDLDQDAIDSYADSLQKLVQSDKDARIGSEKLSSELKNNEDAATKVSEAVTLMNMGVKKLADGFDDWSDVLKNSSKCSQEYAEAMKSTKDAVSDLLGVSKDSLTDTFIADNLKDIGLAAKGDADAIDRLADSFGQDFIANLDIKDDKVRTKVENLHSQLMDEIPNIEVGATLETGDFLKNAKKLVSKSKMTVDEANEYFKGIGFDAEFEEKDYEMPIYDDVTTTKNITLGQITEQKGIKLKEPFTYVESSVTTTDQKDSGKKKIVKIPKFGKNSKFKLTKTKGGSANNGSSANRGGNTTTTGNKGKGSTASLKKKDKKKNEVDPYKEVNRELDKISKKLSEIQEKNNKLIGTQYLKTLKEQSVELEKQNKLSEKKQRIAVQEAEKNKKKLRADKNTNVKFGADGEITNYNKSLKQKLDWYNESVDKYNKLVKRYNKLSKSEKEKQKDSYDKQAKKLEKEVNKREKSYEKFKKYLEDYEKALDTIAEMRENIRSNLEKEVELGLQAIEHKIQLHIDTDQLKKDWSSFINDVVKGLSEDNPLDLAQLTKTAADNARNIDMNNVTRYSNRDAYLLDQKKKMDAGQESDYSRYDKVTGIWYVDEQKWLEDYRDNFQKMRDSAQAVRDAIKETEQAQLTAIENVASAYDDITSVLEAINEHNEHNIKLTEMLYGEEAYDKMEGFYQKRTENAKAQLENSKDQIAYWQEALAKAEKEGNEEQVKSIKENLNEAIQAFDNNLEKVAEAIRDEFNNSIKSMVKGMNDAFAQAGGYSSMDSLDRDWELNDKVAEAYLDDVNRKYSTSILASNFEDAIDSAATLSAQEQLTALMREQLDILEKKDKLSQYDVDRAQKMLDLELKRIALEEARENKTALKLKRDAQGNYSYQYSADQDAIDKAQADYDKSKQEYYNFVKDRSTEESNNVVQNQKDFASALSSLSEEYGKGNLTEEEYNKEVDNLAEKYSILAQGRAKDAETAFKDLRDYLSRYEGMNDTEIEEYLKRNFSNYSSIQGILKGEDTSYADLAKQAKEQGAKFKKAQKEVEDANNEQSSNINKTQKANAESAKEMVTQLEAAKTAIDDLATSLKTTTTGTKAWNKAMNKAQKTYERLVQFEQDVDKSTNKSGLNGGKDYNNEKELDGVLDKGELVIVKKNSKIYKKNGKQDGKKKVEKEGTYKVEEITKNLVKLAGLGWIKKSRISGFDTGGYTGEWGSKEGRLALLHQKEIVLNADDTKNFLAAVSAVRQISAKGIVDKISQAYNNFSSRVNSVHNTSSSNEELKQNITINAEFPNATNSKEIEQAFSSLSTKAMQYAWSKDIDKR